MKNRILGFGLCLIPVLLLAVWTLFLEREPKELVVGIIGSSDWSVPYTENGKSIRLAVKAFQKEFPGYKIRIEKGVREEDYPEWLMEQFLQGTEPDVFLLDQDLFFLMQERGGLLDLSQRIREDPEVKDSLFFSPLWDANCVNSKCYALPFLCNPQLMAVNDSLLEEKKIPSISDNWTWSELRQKCRSVASSSDGSKEKLYGIGGYTWEMAAYANGSLLFNRDGSDNMIHETAVAEAVNYVFRMGKLIEESAVFENGNVAFFPMWATECRKYTDFPISALKYNGFEWHCTLMPAGPSGKNASQTELISAAISSRTRYPKAAFAFLKCLSLNEEVQQSLWHTTSAVPALRSSVETHQFEASSVVSCQVLLFALENCVVLSRFTGYKETMVHLDSLIKDSLKKSGKIEVSLLQIHRQITDYRKQLIL